MHPGPEARAPPSSPAPRHLRPKRVRADGPRTIHVLRCGARSPRRGRARGPHRRDLRRVRVLRLAPGRGGAAPPGRGGEQQEAAAPHARARPTVEAASTILVTTDSDHAGPIYPDLAKDLVADR